ncbi:MAG: hypothetical protein JKY65_09945 [Planctomycetes bacterium]|nr:hypothetical protein [Planctomycetota bacterium]
MPELTFDEQGLCAVCTEYERWRPRLEAIRSGERWAEKLTHGRSRAAGDHDVVAGLSGGKDSTFVLHQLVRTYGLRVKVVTVVNGFMTDWARENVEAQVAELGVDHVYVEPPQAMLAPLYTAALASTGGICTGCSYMTFSALLTLAERERIPMVVHGRSPAQMLRFITGSSRDADLPFLEAAFEPPSTVDLGATYAASFDRIRQSLPPAHWPLFEKLLPDPTSDHLADFLPYFLHHAYDERAIVDYLDANTSWQRHPESVLLRHYDCRACDASNYLCEQRVGRPHILPEVSATVRFGQLTRDEGQARLEAEQFAEPPDASLDALAAFIGRSRAETLALATGAGRGKSS